MATIETVLALHDEMSVALKAMTAGADKLNESMAITKLATKTVGKELAATADVQVKYVDITGQLNEKIGGLTYELEQMKKQYKELAGSIGDATQSKQDFNKEVDLGGRGTSFMTMGLNRTLGAFGAMPKSIGNATMGLNMLNRGLAATVPMLGAVTAKMAPLLLVSTAAFGLVSIFRNMREEGEDLEIIPRTFDDLNREALTLSSRLEDNIEQMRILNSVGANDAIIERFARTNEELRTLLDLSGIVTRDMAQQEAIAASHRWFGQDYHYVEVRMAPHIEAWNIEEAIRAGGIAQDVDPFYFIREYKPSDFAFYKELIRSVNAWDELGHAQQRAIMSLGQELPGYIETFRNAGEITDEHADAMLRLAQEVVDLNPELLELSRVLGQQREEVDALVGSYVDAERAFRDMRRGVSQSLRGIQRSMGQYNTMIDAVTSAHYTLSDAIATMNGGYDLSIDQFKALNALAPEHLFLLMAEKDALHDVEDATSWLYEMQKQLMGLEMANRMLDMVSSADEATLAMLRYADSTNDATNAVWGLIEAQAQLFHADYGIDLRGHLASIHEWTQSAVGTARGGGRATFTSDGALRTANQNPIEIKGENLRMLMDIAERRRAEALRPINLTANVSIDKPVIHDMADYEQIENRITHSFVKKVYEAYYANARS